jgi:predicted phosphodiesterase
MMIIGDIHGKYEEYLSKIQSYDGPSIQIGDFGIGLRATPPDLFDQMKKHDARFFRGNHDNPEFCKMMPQYISDGHVEGDMMMVGGAFSIDWMYRVIGHSWWLDEELSIPEFEEVIKTFETAKPKIMLTHDCPVVVIPYIHNHNSLFPSSRTQLAFQAMWELYRPQLWIFGHHHKSFDMTLDGTRFICLNELETLFF